MDKRYQVFVSSTYADLKEERRTVIQALMEMDCIPAGMELFPAADDEQWEFIKRVIDDCDYYLLIIGGRYGSLTEDGISYTEMEFEYAVSKGIRVLGFLHGEPDDIPVGKSDIAPEIREKLDAFRAKVQTGRLIKFWKSAQELPGLVALSLGKTIKAYPAVGWVRASTASSAEVLGEINELRKHNADLAAQLKSLRRTAPTVAVSDLAPLDASVTVRGMGTYGGGAYKPWSITTTWAKLFAMFAPQLLGHPSDTAVKAWLAKQLLSSIANYASHPSINEEDFDTVKIQLKALGLVDIVYSTTTAGGAALFWNLTAAGSEAMMRLRTVRGEQK